MTLVTHVFLKYPYARAGRINNYWFIIYNYIYINNYINQLSHLSSVTKVILFISAIDSYRNQHR